MKGKVGRKSRRKILIQRIEVHVDSLPQAGINYGVTKEKRKIERFNLPGFQQPAEGCTAKIHFYKIRIVFFPVENFQFQISSNFLFHTILLSDIFSTDDIMRHFLGFVQNIHQINPHDSNGKQGDTEKCQQYEHQGSPAFHGNSGSGKRFQVPH